MQCEGWRRRGGVFTFGPVIWYQCENEATVTISVKQDDGISTLPGCNTCWQEAIENKDIEVLSVEPINDNQALDHTV